MKRLTLLAALLLAAPAAFVPSADGALAQRYTPVTGQQLVELCTSRDRVKVEQCTTYIDGVSDSATFYQELLPEDGSKGGRLPAYICVPGRVTGRDLRTAVVAWARDHRENLRLQASGFVLRALRDGFACNR